MSCNKISFRSKVYIFSKDIITLKIKFDFNNLVIMNQPFKFLVLL